MKKQIEIERLLQWAFREELPKGLPVTATPWEAISRFTALGVRIDTSGYGPADNALGRVPGEPHDDAAAIAFHVKRLPKNLSLGSEDDARYLLGVLFDLDRDAVMAVMRASYNMAAIVIHHAVMGSAPEWDLGSPTPSAVRRASDGKPAVMGFDRDGEFVTLKANAGRRGMIEPYNLWQSPRSLLKWDDPSVGMIAEARAEFTIWHAGLVRLCDELNAVMRDHAALAPSLPPAPWFTGMPPAPVVLRPISADGSALTFMPLAPDRRGEAIERGRAQRREVAALRRAERKRLRDESRAALAAIDGNGAENRGFAGDCSPPA